MNMKPIALALFAAGADLTEVRRIEALPGGHGHQSACVVGQGSPVIAGGTLWLARATPRAWLQQGKKISVKNAPTCFGALAYEIVSDVDNGKINATVEMPSRKAPKEVVLRFRHPKSASIKSVTVDGKPWTEFNKDKETITLKGLTGNVAVTAQY